MTKFYKATDGKITAFRATASGRAYQSAQLTGKGGIGFRSAKALPPATFPAVEITKAEYDALQAAKVERLKAEGKRGSYTSPQDSWVRNASLPDAKPAQAAKVLTGARGRVQAAKVRLAAAKQEATGMPGPALLAKVINQPFAKAAKLAKAAKARGENGNTEKLGAALQAIADEKAAARKAAKPAKAAKVNGKPAPREGSFQAAMIKVLVRKQGATRPEMMAAAGSKTMPNAHFLNLMADRFGYECYADKADRADVLVYQFVLPGQKPTAYGEEG